MKVSYWQNSKEETRNSRCEASSIIPYFPQQSYTSHLNHPQHWGFTELNIKRVQLISGVIDSIGAIAESGLLTSDQSILENASRDCF